MNERNLSGETTVSLLQGLSFGWILSCSENCQRGTVLTLPSYFLHSVNGEITRRPIGPAPEMRNVFAVVEIKDFADERLTLFVSCFFLTYRSQRRNISTGSLTKRFANCGYWQIRTWPHLDTIEIRILIHFNRHMNINTSDIRRLARYSVTCSTVLWIIISRRNLSQRLRWGRSICIIDRVL